MVLLKNNFLHIIIFIIVLIICAAPQNVKSDSIDDKLSTEQRKIFQQVEGNILSPFCPGRLLKDCPSTATRNLKEDIKSKILAGEDADSIKTSLFEEYGSELRAAPENTGIGLLAWYLPLVFLIVGFFLIVFYLRKQITSDQ
jgi:cytochrome c-type biogenesis protein CcmH